MASVLRRFRRLAPPGGAMAGVSPPEDVDAERHMELASVFATLDAVQRDVDGILDAAHREADRITATAVAGAAALLARARDDAVLEKARVSQERMSSFAGERAAVLTRAHAQAAAIRNSASARADAAAVAVVERLRALAADGEARRGR